MSHREFIKGNADDDYDLISEAKHQFTIKVDACKKSTHFERDIRYVVDGFRNQFSDDFAVLQFVANYAKSNILQDLKLDNLNASQLLTIKQAHQLRLFDLYELSLLSDSEAHETAELKMRIAEIGAHMKMLGVLSFEQSFSAFGKYGDSVE